MEQNQVQETISLPRIGDKTPEFKAITTQGEINFPVNYKGKWIILLATQPILPLCVLQSL